MDEEQLVEYVILPTLKKFNMVSLAGSVLLLGTALEESRLKYIKQLGSGPALGLWQMEPATHKDIYLNYLRYRMNLIEKLEEVAVNFDRYAPDKMSEQLPWNLAYACAMARIHYLRVPEALPSATDAEAMAMYHKVHYNTILGASNVEESVKHFEKAIDVCLSVMN